MKLIINDNEIITATGYQWSGSKASVARSLVFSIVINNPKIPTYVVNVGDTVVLQDEDNSIIFKGRVLVMDYSKSGDVINYTCYDYLWNLNKSKAVGVYKGTINEIYSSICSVFGLTSGVNSSSSIVHTVISTGDKTYYQILDTVRKSVYGEKSNISVSANTVNIDTDITPVFALDTDLNIINVTYSSDISELVSQVKYINDTGAIIDTFTNDSDASQYGLVINTYEYQQNKDNVNIAKEELKTIDNNCSIESLGSVLAYSGKYLTVTDGNNTALFEIGSDSHSISNAGHTMSIEVLV